MAYALDTVIVINAGQSWRGVVTTGDRCSGAAHCAARGAGCVAALLLVARRVDINEFSLNAFYRNRLVRCYLGATRFEPGERNPQNFTGFDDKDDLPLADLVDLQAPPRGPLHIVNCALNLGGSSDLALHTRHSAAFTLTPLVLRQWIRLARRRLAKASELGYIPTSEYGGRLAAPTLGQAISVSGAAASPTWATTPRRSWHSC